MRQGKRRMVSCEWEFIKKLFQHFIQFKLFVSTITVETIVCLLYSANIIYEAPIACFSQAHANKKRKQKTHLHVWRGGVSSTIQSTPNTFTIFIAFHPFSDIKNVAAP